MGNSTTLAPTGKARCAPWCTDHHDGEGIPGAAYCSTTTPVGPGAVCMSNDSGSPVIELHDIGVVLSPAHAERRGGGRDRSRPDEQNKRRAIRFWITRAKKCQPMSKHELAELTGFSDTWALGCIQDARAQLIDRGWEFDDKGVPTPPRSVADPVATGGGG
ncbi:hypothetical protein DQ384_33955 [Sphaerisporangium album]|uniref:Uncharacterized protein n=1 Tax=Sphaerisporangium album TaxID=509200 RepID=A0A367F0P6_9ACTN|nr:hypothetical protein [Sphaerisporangium album]RCG23375.1 hypothetical protein DQ384_33955 [Sphaerisporangium album]